MRTVKIKEERFSAVKKTDLEIKIHFGSEILHDLLEYTRCGKLKDPWFFSSAEEIELYIRTNSDLIDFRFTKTRTTKKCIICGEDFTRPVHKRDVCWDCLKAVKLKWYGARKTDPNADYQSMMEEAINSKLL